jgi:hypothetical protein
MRYMLGHDAPPTNFWRENLLTRAPLAECPLRTILKREAAHPQLAREMNAHFRYYPAYTHGALLVQGGVADQPNRYLEYMALIDGSAHATEARYYELLREQTEAERESVTAQRSVRDGAYD